MNDIEKKELAKKNQLAKINSMNSLTILEVVMYILVFIALAFSIYYFYRSFFIGVIFIVVGIVFFVSGRILNKIMYNRDLLKEIYIELNNLKQKK